MSRVVGAYKTYGYSKDGWVYGIGVRVYAYMCIWCIMSIGMYQTKHINYEPVLSLSLSLHVPISPISALSAIPVSSETEVEVEELVEEYPIENVRHPISQHCTIARRTDESCINDHNPFDNDNGDGFVDVVVDDDGDDEYISKALYLSLSLDIAVDVDFDIGART